MTSVQPIYVAVPQQNNQNKTGRHVANAAVTTLGVGATTAALSRGVKTAVGVCGDEIALTNGSKILKRNTGKVYQFFEKAGQKLFGENTKLGKAIERYVTGKMPSGGTMASPEQIKAVLKKSKTIGAMALTAGVTVLTLLARAIYKAGKINGQS